MIVGLVIGAAVLAAGYALGRHERRSHQRLVELAVRAALAETRADQVAYSASEHARQRKAHKRQLAAIRERVAVLQNTSRTPRELVPAVEAIAEAAQEREP